MSKDIELMQKELDALKLEERKKKIAKTIKDNKMDNYYVSHKLDRRFNGKPTYLFAAYHLEGPYYDEQVERYYYNMKQAYVNKNVGDDINSAVVTSTVELSGAHNYKAKYEITKEEFDTLCASLHTGILDTVDSIRYRFKQDRMMTQGAHTREVKASALLELAGVEYVDLKDDNIFNILEKHNFPYLVNSGFYANTGWLKMMHSIVKDMRNQIGAYAGIYDSRLRSNITALSNYIKKVTYEN